MMKPIIDRFEALRYLAREFGVIAAKREIGLFLNESELIARWNLGGITTLPIRISWQSSSMLSFDVNEPGRAGVSNSYQELFVSHQLANDLLASLRQEALPVSKVSISFFRTMLFINQTDDYATLERILAALERWLDTPSVIALAGATQGWNTYLDSRFIPAKSYLRLPYLIQNCLIKRTSKANSRYVSFEGSIRQRINGDTDDWKIPLRFSLSKQDYDPLTGSQVIHFTLQHTHFKKGSLAGLKLVYPYKNIEAIVQTKSPNSAVYAFCNSLIGHFQSGYNNTTFSEIVESNQNPLYIFFPNKNTACLSTYKYSCTPVPKPVQLVALEVVSSVPCTSIEWFGDTLMFYNNDPTRYACKPSKMPKGRKTFSWTREINSVLQAAFHLDKLETLS